MGRKEGGNGVPLLPGFLFDLSRGRNSSGVSCTRPSPGEAHPDLFHFVFGVLSSCWPPSNTPTPWVDIVANLGNGPTPEMDIIRSWILHTQKGNEPVAQFAHTVFCRWEPVAPVE